VNKKYISVNIIKGANYIKASVRLSRNIWMKIRLAMANAIILPHLLPPEDFFNGTHVEFSGHFFSGSQSNQASMVQQNQLVAA
jgi:hypothetical protein